MVSITCSFLNQNYTLSQLQNLSLSGEMVDDLWKHLSFYLEEEHFLSYLNYSLAQLTSTTNGLMQVSNYAICCRPISDSDASRVFILQLFKRDRLFYQFSQTFPRSLQGLSDLLSLLKDVLEMELTLVSEQLSPDTVNGRPVYQTLLTERPHQATLILELFATHCADEILKNYQLSPASLNEIQFLSVNRMGETA